MPEKQRRDERHAIRHQGVADVYPISAKTAAYQILADDIGTLFTNRGDTDAITFTLPVVTDLPVGWWCKFFTVGAAAMGITSSGSADNLVVFNDATADSITYSTATEIIGNGIEVVWDGTSWLVFNHLGSETATPTIA